MEENWRNYQGMSCKPKDFEEYWQQGLQEIANLEIEYKLTPSEFQINGVEAFDLYFKSTKNSWIYCKYLRPKNIHRKLPTVLQFHGYTGGSGDWTEKMHFVAAGMAVVAMDCRGQGGLSEDGGRVKGTTLNGHIIRGLSDQPQKMIYRDVFLDTAMLARVVSQFEEIDETRLVSYGASQGGALALACAALVPQIKRTAVLYPFLCDFYGNWINKVESATNREIETYFKHHDPQGKTEQQIFERLGYIDIQNLAPFIQAEILWGMGLKDLSCPPVAQIAAYNKIKTKKKLVEFPCFGHEPLSTFMDEVCMYLSHWS